MVKEKKEKKEKKKEKKMRFYVGQATAHLTFYNFQNKATKQKLFSSFPEVGSTILYNGSLAFAGVIPFLNTRGGTSKAKVSRKTVQIAVEDTLPVVGFEVSCIFGMVACVK